MYNSMTSGHYNAFVRHGERWWEFNDEKVAIASEDTVDNNKKGQSYLLFFERCWDVEVQG